MGGKVSLTYPDGPRVVTVVISVDGEVEVAISNQAGATLRHGAGRIDVERAQRVIRDLRIASQLPHPTGHEIVLALHDSYVDPSYGETRGGSVWQPARDLASEILGSTKGPQQRSGVVPYTPLSFIKWTLAFAAALGAALAVSELAAQWYGDGIQDFIDFARNPEPDANDPPYTALIITPVVVFFAYVGVGRSFIDTHRRDARPLWPALFGTAPFAAAAYAYEGNLGVLIIAAFLAPSLMVAVTHALYGDLFDMSDLVWRPFRMGGGG